MEQYDLICTGTALVDSIIRGLDPEPVSPAHYLAEEGTLSVGGEAVNEAIAAAQLGLKTAVLCRLGEDTAGELLLRELRRCGVDTAPVLRTAEPTPVSTLLVAADGTRRSVMNRSHRAGFRPDCRWFSGAGAVTLGSLFRAPYDDPETVYRTVRAAKEAGALVFADTKVPNFTKRTLSDLRESLALVDYIFPNREEAAYFTGESEPEAMAEAFLRTGVRNVILKLGAEGCLMMNGQEQLRLAGIPVRTVDATGAGDNFLAGFISELLRGSTAARALRFANACGALSTTVTGAAGGIRSREQVLEFLSRQG